jgi:flagellin-like protein
MKTIENNENRGARSWRRRRTRESKQAVSPVVATLILILVAVAAAAALYLWLVAWQGGVTKSIGSPNTQYTVTLGGSTSAYNFDQVAINQFEQNNSDVSVSNNGGGAGAGILAVCQGAVDIGVAGSPQTLSTLESADGCPTTTVITTVAYDAVDVIVPTANVHGLTSVNSSVLLGIYLATSTTTPSSFLTMPTYLATAGWTVGGGLKWDQVPQQSGCGFSGTGATFATACTFPTGATSTDAVSTVGRSDTSGGEQIFTAKVLGISGSTLLTSYTSIQSSFTGCGTDGQFASCGITPTVSEFGDAGVISYVASHPDSIGFAADGLVRATGSGVAYVPLAVTGQLATGVSGGITPTLGSTGSIALGITNGGTPATQYGAWRSYQWITTNTPTGEVERLLQYVLIPSNNLNFAAESNTISIYTV